MEGALAAVTARFESMLKTFLATPGGGFEPFIRDYEDRWLHSCVARLPLPSPSNCD